VLNLTESDILTAHFKLKEFADSLVINEINYNSADFFTPGDWVEFFNPHDYNLDITGWQFMDSDDAHVYTFPDSTFIEALDYLVLCRDSVDFSSAFPEVQNYIGELGFGFNSAGELLRLYNENGALVDTVHYGVEDPWPAEPNGNGPTLELINWTYDNALPENWVASELHGTPGEINGMITGIEDGQVVLKEIHFTIYPNPFKESAILQVTSDVDIQDGKLIIFDVFGNNVLEIQNIHNRRVEINRNNLPGGVYVCKLFANDFTVFGMNKMIID